VSTGSTYVCALFTDGTIDCWGGVTRAPGGVDFEPFPQAFAEQRARATFGF